MSRIRRFADRVDAGRRLAGPVAACGLDQPVVLALPRGGVPVGAEVAAALRAPLDVFVVRKVGAPGHEEYGIGAIAEGDVTVADHDALATLGISAVRFDELASAEVPELRRRIAAYRPGRELTEVRDRDVVLVDDGIATGVSADAALRALRQLGARRIVLAAPAAADSAILRLRAFADEIICLVVPKDFRAVGVWYRDFDQTDDAAVVRALEADRTRHRPSPG